VVSTSVPYFGGPRFKTCHRFQLIQLPSVFLTVISCSFPPDLLDSYIKNGQVMENYVISHYLLLMLLVVAFFVSVFPHYAGIHNSVSSSLPTQAYIFSSASFSQMPSSCAVP
jgi:hypothetical protein